MDMTDKDILIEFAERYIALERRARSLESVLQKEQDRNGEPIPWEYKAERWLESPLVHRTFLEKTSQLREIAHVASQSTEHEILQSLWSLVE